MPDTRKLLSILSDQPADRDRLNFGPYVQTLTDILTDPGTDTPLTIGVFGDWGRGKTSLMRMVERQLKERPQDEQATFAVLPVWFNAWLYSREEALWRALVARVLRELRRFPGLDASATADLGTLEARLYAPQRAEAGQLTLPPGALPGLEAASLPALAGLELLRRQAERRGQGEEAQRLDEIIADVQACQALTRRDRIVALDDFRRQFEELSRAHIVDRGRLVIFVDDLDRCLPESAVEVLEAVKLFLDVPGVVFILGVDQRVLEEGIRVRYGQRYDGETPALDGARYLEKIIQIPLNLPHIQPADIEAFVTKVTADLLPDERCQRVFAVGLEPNPRRIKRTLNVFLLLWRLARHRADLQEVIRPVRLAKVVVIQQYHRRLFELLTQGPHYLIDLERRFREVEERGEEGRGVEERGEGGEEISAGPLREFLGRSLLRELLTCTAADEPDANFIDLRPAQVAEYLFLTRSTTQEEVAPAEAARHPFEPQLVTIPAGPFLMGTIEEEVQRLLAEEKDLKREWLEREIPQHSVDLPAYAIARYPVTNAEFDRFVEDGGYQNLDYWTEDGWRVKENESWTQPRFWDDETFNEPAQPVVGVSWYEAVAYCRWLADKTDKPYRLPTEAEWEKAARGADGRRYPWGDEPPMAELCNFGGNVGRPTPVGQYSPRGDSPFGCADMAGNVWEWCATRWQEKYPLPQGDEWDDNYLSGTSPRAWRGGAWRHSQRLVRGASRSRSPPHRWSYGLGLRLVVASWL
jgi:formylglycine-generating enzyme required for sulfatase activity